MTIARELAANQLALHEAADQILLKIAEGELADYDDQLVFDALRWTPDLVRSQAKRISQVKQITDQGGSPAALAAAENKVVELATAHAGERQDLASQLAKLNARLSQMDQAEKQASANRDRLLHLRNTLRNLAPKHVRAEFDKSKRFLDSADNERLRLEDRLRFIEGVLGKTDFDKCAREIVWACESLPADHPAFTRGVDYDRQREPCATGEMIRAEGKGVNLVAYRGYLAELKIERELVTEQIAELTASAAESKAELETLLDYYWEKSGNWS